MSLLKRGAKRAAAILTAVTALTMTDIASADELAKAPLNVNIYVNGSFEETIATDETQTKELLAYYRSYTGEDYFLKRDFKAEVEDNMDLYLISEEDKITVENVEIPFETIRIETDELEIGTEQVKTQGVTGMKKVTTRVHCVGGEPEAVTTEEEVVIEPLNAEVLVGTHDSAAEQAAREAAEQAERERYEAEQAARRKEQAKQTSQGGAPTSCSKVVTMNATAYCPCSKCNGPYAGICANGMKTQYGVVAVDPSFIKLGTRLYVEGYGYCIAADTGGAIKGNRIDLCYNSHSQALASGFGHTNVTVYVLD